MRKADYLEKLFPVGETRYVSGTTALYDGMLQMVHPDRVVDEKGLAALPMVEPVYPLTEGLGINQVRKAIDAAAGKSPGAAGMAGRGLAGAQSLSVLRRCASIAASPRRSVGYRAGRPGLVAARL